MGLFVNEFFKITKDEERYQLKLLKS